ncbi:hypothetical protein ACLBKT_07500 [Erythrobacter sp. W302b]|uniref:hypothetical protein n=1 Tax=Erythrobacter sp. W302b TaxID=3389874 RepID=UPI00396B43E6
MSGAEKILKVIAEWGQEAVTQYKADGAYAFGSLVYLEGEQLTASSDIDLVILVPKSAEGPVARAEWLERFFPHKEKLEFELLKVLQRDIIEEPFSSVIPVTQLEIEIDLHKQNLPSFFSANQFLDLQTEGLNEGLVGAATKECHRFMAGSLSMAQSMRHRFLGVAANTRRFLLEPHSGSDPIPKPIMRAAAMARSLTVNGAKRGAEYDLRLGLDYVCKYLFDQESSSERLQALNKLVSERRGGRGRSGPLSEAYQLLLAEIVYELAAKAGDAPDQITAGSNAASTHNASTSNIKPVVEAPAVGQSQAPSGGPPENHSDHEREAFGATGRSTSMLPPFKGGTSLAFFEDRFRQAFPGVRETTWFDDPKDILDRLSRLLSPPLKFADASPIWWWRGGNFQIEAFKLLEPDLALMDHDELKIRRAAAVPGPSYKWNFVYIETHAMEPTGLYDYNEFSIDERLKTRSYVTEEYGLLRGKHYISREEYDDGGTYLDGKYVDTIGQTQLRKRYVTPYNFVIAPQGSPINNSAFDRHLVAMLDSALAGNPIDAVDMLREEVARLPLKREW